MIKLIADERNLRSWVWRRLRESGVKQSMQVFVGVILDPRDAEKSGAEKDISRCGEENIPMLVVQIYAISKKNYQST